MKRALLALVAAAAAGCSSLKIPDEVAVATAVSCIDEQTKAELDRLCPQIRSDEELLDLDDYKVVQAIRVDRKLAAGCMKAQAAAIAVCAQVPASVSGSSSLGGRRVEGAPAEIPPAPILKR